MILIKKSNDPPEAFRGLDKKYSFYDKVDPEIIWDMRTELVNEQGCLCAYCMNKITAEKSTIEHYTPRHGKHGSTDLSLDYRNMFAVCAGREGSGKANLHCDKSKGSNLLSIDPRKEEDIKQIEYKMDGTIYSPKQEFNKDLDETLNLNHIVLKRNRESALKSALSNIFHYNSNGQNNENLQIIKDHYSKANNVPYVGIIRWFIDKNL